MIEENSEPRFPPQGRAAREGLFGSFVAAKQHPVDAKLSARLAAYPRIVTILVRSEILGAEQRFRPPKTGERAKFPMAGFRVDFL